MHTKLFNAPHFRYIHANTNTRTHTSSCMSSRSFLSQIRWHHFAHYSNLRSWSSVVPKIGSEFPCPPSTPMDPMKPSMLPVDVYVCTYVRMCVVAFLTKSGILFCWNSVYFFWKMCLERCMYILAPPKFRWNSDSDTRAEMLGVSALRPLETARMHESCFIWLTVAINCTGPCIPSQCVSCSIQRIQGFGRCTQLSGALVVWWVLRSSIPLDFCPGGTQIWLTR